MPDPVDEIAMLNLAEIRAQFPALRPRDGLAPVYLDGPGGTQVPQAVIEAISNYLRGCNANHGGAFRTSRSSDEMLNYAHAAVADLLHAPSPDEVIFGLNMTSLTFQISRSLAKQWKRGEAIVVTQLDHDANIRPWMLAAEDVGVEVRVVPITPEGTLNEEVLQRHLTGPVRLLALTCASNALGTMPDVARLTRLAHAAGALVFLDAVHYAPHAVIDVQAWDCDFLACSAYKFFGPHVGILWGRRALLEQLPAYKVRPASEALPGKWMTGTQNHEGIAGTLAAIDYLASLGRGSTRRQRLVQAMHAIREYETRLLRCLLVGLRERPAWRVWGLTAENQLSQRTPTLGLTHVCRSAQEIAEFLAQHEIYAWSGNFYALELVEALGLGQGGGLLRLGIVHYNTDDEMQRTLDVLGKLD